MRAELLLDTGALVTLLDRSQPRHSEFVGFFKEWDGIMLSTEAVLAEASHLLGRVSGGAASCVEGGAVLVPSSPASLRRAHELMQKYHDLPMDFADATLVVLAEDVGTDLVFTTDLLDFRVYRIRGRGKFRIRPE